jgi:hypothetical protein
MFRTSLHVLFDSAAIRPNDSSRTRSGRPGPNPRTIALLYLPSENSDWRDLRDTLRCALSGVERGKYIGSNSWDFNIQRYVQSVCLFIRVFDQIPLNLGIRRPKIIFSFCGLSGNFRLGFSELGDSTTHYTFAFRSSADVPLISE